MKITESLRQAISPMPDEMLIEFMHAEELTKTPLVLKLNEELNPNLIGPIDGLVLVAELFRAAGAELARRLEQRNEFKALVHGRLDAAGVPDDPKNARETGCCRISDRLDEVLMWYKARPETMVRITIDREIMDSIAARASAENTEMQTIAIELIIAEGAINGEEVSKTARKGCASGQNGR